MAYDDALRPGSANARIAQLEREKAQYQRAYDVLLAVAEGTATATGPDFFAALARQIARVLGVSHAFVTECTDESRARLRTLAYWDVDHFAAPFEYDVEGTPCARVIDGALNYQPRDLRRVYFPAGLQKLFPDEAGIESYLGIPVADPAHGVLGHLVVMDTRPMDDQPLVLAVLRLFAARAAAELLRLRLEAERALASDILRRSQMAENLRDILVVLNSDSTLDRILEQLVARAQHILEADEAMLCREEPERCIDVLRPRLNDPASADAILSVMAQAAETRFPAALADIAALPTAPGDHAAAPPRQPDIFRGVLVVPLVVDEALYGCILLAYAAPRGFSSEDLNLAAALGEHVVLAIENAQLREQARQMAAMEERNRIARELHDAVSQTLWSANLIADVLPDIFEQNAERGRFKLDQFRQLTRAALIEMRSLLLELRPNALVETALHDLLGRLTETVSARSGLPIRLTTEDDCALPPDVQITVYRIAQEAINNAVRHASAAHIEVLLRCAPERLELAVMDDGRGFDAGARRQGHHGLAIMSERAASIGGHLRIVSQFGKGTVVQFHWKPT